MKTPKEIAGEIFVAANHDPLYISLKKEYDESVERNASHVVIEQKLEDISNRRSYLIGIELSSLSNGVRTEVAAILDKYEVPEETNRQRARRRREENTRQRDYGVTYAEL